MAEGDLHARRDKFLEDLLQGLNARNVQPTFAQAQKVVGAAISALPAGTLKTSLTDALPDVLNELRRRLSTSGRRQRTKRTAVRDGAATPSSKKLKSMYSANSQYVEACKAPDGAASAALLCARLPPPPALLQSLLPPTLEPAPGLVTDVANVALGFFAASCAPESYLALEPLAQHIHVCVEGLGRKLLLVRPSCSADASRLCEDDRRILAECCSVAGRVRALCALTRSAPAVFPPAHRLARLPAASLIGPEGSSAPHDAARVQYRLLTALAAVDTLSLLLRASGKVHLKPAKLRALLRALLPAAQLSARALLSAEDLLACLADADGTEPPADAAADGADVLATIAWLLLHAAADAPRMLEGAPAALVLDILVTQHRAGALHARLNDRGASEAAARALDACGEPGSLCSWLAAQPGTVVSEALRAKATAAAGEVSVVRHLMHATPLSELLRLRAVQRSGVAASGAEGAAGGQAAGVADDDLFFVDLEGQTAFDGQWEGGEGAADAEEDDGEPQEDVVDEGAAGEAEEESD